MRLTTFVPADQIIVPDNRQRQEFDGGALVELAQSIKANGLLHAIVVRMDGRTLVAGERRLRAIRQFVYAMGGSFAYDGVPVEVGLVPVIRVDAADALALEEIELDENIRRADLTWQERAEAEARLHRIRSARNPEQTLGDTAKELADAAGILPKVAQDNLRQSLVVMKVMAELPEIGKAKTLKDAFKMVQRHEETKRNERLAASVGQTYSTKALQALHGDCLDLLAEAQWNEKFDVILTDPPYGMGADQFGDAAGRLATIEHHYDDSYESWKDLMARWTSLAWRVTKPQAHAYIFCDIDRFHELKLMMQAAGWYVFRTPLINVKNSGRVPLPDRGPRRQYEICLYAIKGDKLVTGIYSDVIHSEADEQMGHGAQKPVSLYTDLLKRSCRPGDWVLDSFSGSGTIFPAAFELQLYAVGVEQNAASYGKGLERIAGLK